MADPIGTAASAVSILDRAAAVLRWLRGRAAGKQPQLPGRPAHMGFELRPAGFHIDLTQSQPRVELGFYAINYLRRGLVLTEVKVTQLYVSGGPQIEHVPLVQRAAGAGATRR